MHAPKDGFFYVGEAAAGGTRSVASVDPVLAFPVTGQRFHFSTAPICRV